LQQHDRADRCPLGSEASQAKLPSSSQQTDSRALLAAPEHIKHQFCYNLYSSTAISIIALSQKLVHTAKPQQRHGAEQDPRYCWCTIFNRERWSQWAW